MKRRYLTLVLVMILCGCFSACKQDETSGSSSSDVPATNPAASQATNTITAPTVNPYEGAIYETPVVPDSDLKNAILGRNISGTFKESVANGTTITFNNNGTFDSNLNICSGMKNVSGTYTFDGTTITLYFPESTGVNFVDSDQPFTFVVDGKGFKLAENAPYYSCSYVDEYVPK